MSGINGLAFLLSCSFGSSKPNLIVLSYELRVAGKTHSTQLAKLLNLCSIRKWVPHPFPSCTRKTCTALCITIQHSFTQWSSGADQKCWVSIAPWSMSGCTPCTATLAGLIDWLYTHLIPRCPEPFKQSCQILAGTIMRFSSQCSLTNCSPN